MIRLVGKKFIFGRDPDCSLPVESDVASRRHVRVALEGAGWVVEDLQSRNGTTLNGQPVLRAPLQWKDVLQLGPDGPSLKVIDLGVDAKLELDLGATMSAVPPMPTPAPVQPRAKPVAPPPAAESASRRSLRVPWVAIAGLAAGIVTALSIWPDAFPYAVVCAPVLRGIEALGQAWPAWTAAKAGWLLVSGLALYGLAVGLSLQRPLRRWAPLLVLIALHAWAVWAV